ncbi:UNVERIFIED_CONTAM: hypothetical protein Sindi_2888100 [Sesamum indicum]
MSSKSRSVSVHVSVSESTKNSEPSSSSGSSATSPTETVGTSRDPTASISQPSDLSEEVDESDVTPIFQKYTEMMQQKPWLGIASIIKMTPVALKRKYYIPADYDIKIPRSFDHMHQPPEGYCALSVLHLDAGLRSPLPREEKVLKLEGLSPALIPVKSSLESEIMLARLVNKTRAKKGTLPPSIDRELKQATAAVAAKGKSKARVPTPTPSPNTAASEQQSAPTASRDRAPDEQVEVVEISEDRNLKRKRGKEAAIPETESAPLTEIQSDPSSRSTKQGRLEAKLAADRVAEPVNRKKFTTSQQVWQKTRDERPASARRAEMSGGRWVPDWNISKSSSVLRTFAAKTLGRSTKLPAWNAIRSSSRKPP